MNKLPDIYITRTEQCLEDEAEAFLLSYDKPRTQGLRINPLKFNSGDPTFSKLKQELQLEQVPWCPTGYYYEEPIKPGKHPYHAAGVYYIQEPSAMSSVELLSPVPGDIVLDLAAAPGGKSTQIAGKLLGRGLLVANEIHPARAKILSENIERLGITNAIVTNASPDKLSERFPAFFDKIMLDAPCSGEGMFRKDPQAIEEWSLEHVGMCAARQMDILHEAVKMLKAGGIMGYSTCTFNREENEDTMKLLLQQYPELELVAEERIWPHLHKGEGHYVAIVRKHETHTSIPEKLSDRGSSKAKGFRKTEPAPTHQVDKNLQHAKQLFDQFHKESLPDFKLKDGEPVLFGDQLYWLPAAEGSSLGSQMLLGLRILRPGLHLGTVKKNRFEPSHALALALSLHAAEASHVYELSSHSTDVMAYLRGEALFTERTSSGWVVITVDGFPLGWGKESAGQLKNHYPKGLRRFF
jgi:NOL1/NOP2/sun family putative RNA methylase